MKIIRSLAGALAIIRIAARGGWDAEIYEPWDDDEYLLG
ncbi:hypothetical protein SEA_JERM_1 [Mycobacterium phage Jerm]|uniref:Uncharacterized protein n=1 Tax=Mycobacterium phage Jerm TaxID=1897503 RepID=A0A1D8EZM9_9CAUD|nr:hypothetical protein SEA_JERM_1 [Mycobacterium phage Jerm]